MTARVTRRYEWDGVERELILVGVGLRRVADAFQALAGELQRERGYATLAVGDRGEPVEKSNKTRGASPLPVWKDRI